MKLSTALCALSLTSWSLAAPIVTSSKPATPKYSGPQITSTTESWPIRTHRFTLGEEEDDAGVQNVLEARPDNRPYSPSSDVAPSEALASPRPLETSYLLAIKPFLVPSDKKAESPASPQPDMMDSSTLREETGSNLRHNPTIVELETKGNMPSSWTEMPCIMENGHIYVVRRYVDVTVVRIVFILIAVLAIVELWDPICIITSRIFVREGGIRLLDEELTEKAQLEIQYSDFVLQPAPKTRTRSPTTPEMPESKQ